MKLSRVRSSDIDQVYASIVSPQTRWIKLENSWSNEISPGEFVCKSFDRSDRFARPIRPEGMVVAKLDPYPMYDERGEGEYFVLWFIDP